MQGAQREVADTIIIQQGADRTAKDIKNEKSLPSDLPERLQHKDSDKSW